MNTASLLLGKALDLLGNPAYGGATLLLLGQHGHHGLGKQVRVLPMAHHFLKYCREREFGLSRLQQQQRRKEQMSQFFCRKLPSGRSLRPGRSLKKGAFHTGNARPNCLLLLWDKQRTYGKLRKVFFKVFFSSIQNCSQRGTKYSREDLQLLARCRHTGYLPLVPCVRNKLRHRNKEPNTASAPNV